MRYILIIGLLSSMYLNAADTLENIYSKALNYEAKVQSYKYQKLAKKEEIKQAKSRLYPTITAETSATYRDYTLNYNGENRDERYYTLTISSQIPIYHPEYYNAIDQSGLKYDYAALHLEQLKQQLAYNVTDYYLQIIRAKNSLGVAKSYLKTNKARYEQIKKMFEKRLANKMDLLSSKVTYEQSKIKVNQEKQNLKLARYKFRNLTGIKDIDIEGINLENVDITPLIIDKTKDDLKNMNIDIRKSDINIKLTKKEIKNATYGHYPKVDLTASVSKYDARNNYTDYTDDARFVLRVKLPIYQGGYVTSNTAKYRYLLNAAQEDLKDTTREVSSKFEESMINLKTAKKNITLYKEAIKSAELYLHAVTRGYESGLKNLIDIEDAKTKLFEAKFKLIDSVYTYIKSYTQIENLLGRLDKVRLEKIDNVLFK